MRQELGRKLGTDVPLVIIESPYRALVGPLLAYIDAVDRQRPGRHADGGAAGVRRRATGGSTCSTTRRRCGSRRRCCSVPAPS